MLSGGSKRGTSCYPSIGQEDENKIQLMTIPGNRRRDFEFGFLFVTF